MNDSVKKANSLYALSKVDKDSVKRRDSMTIRPELLVIEEGFNVRGVGMSQEEYWEQEHVKEHVLNLSFAYENGDYVPPIVVKFREDDQKAVIRDGHHRYRGLLLAMERGAAIQYVAVTEFKGDEAKQQLLMLTSSNSLELSPVEKAEIFHRLFSYGFTPDQIAKQINKSITHVTQMLKVYDLPLEKKRAIQQKKLKVTNALAEATNKNKPFTPPKKAVKEVLGILSTKATIEGDIVRAEIPLELWKLLMEPELEPATDNHELPLDDGADEADNE